MLVLTSTRWTPQTSLKTCLSHPVDREARVTGRCGVGVVEGIFHARKEEDACIQKGRERVPQAVWIVSNKFQMQRSCVVEMKGDVDVSFSILQSTILTYCPDLGLTLGTSSA